MSHHENKRLTYNSHYIGVKNLYKVFKKDQKIKNFIQIWFFRIWKN